MSWNEEGENRPVIGVVGAYMRPEGRRLYDLRGPAGAVDKTLRYLALLRPAEAMHRRALDRELVARGVDLAYYFLASVITDELQTCGVLDQTMIDSLRAKADMAIVSHATTLGSTYDKARHVFAALGLPLIVVGVRIIRTEDELRCAIDLPNLT